jgi:hypothetical protein
MTAHQATIAATEAEREIVGRAVWRLFVADADLNVRIAGATIFVDCFADGSGLLKFQDLRPRPFSLDREPDRFDPDVPHVDVPIDAATLTAMRRQFRGNSPAQDV